MKRFKKILCAFAALLLAFGFAGCGEYKPPVNSGDNPPVIEKPDPTPKPTPDPDDPVDDPVDDGFTVTLTCDGVPFTRANYSAITSLSAQWTDTQTKQVYRANFNAEGVARRNDLDGDYKVTLAGLPDGYTYEPNGRAEDDYRGYFADNDYKEVRIQLFKLTRLAAPTIYGGSIGTDSNVPVYEINNIGAYRVTLHSEDEKVFFRYHPDKNGVYTLTSMVDVTANEINPKMDIFNGSSQFINPIPAVQQDGGAAENTYTKNFNAEYTISADEVGNVMIFRLHSTCRNANAYPLGVDFILDRDGDFKREYLVAETVPVTEDFDNTPEQPAGTFVYCANRPGNPNKLLDSKQVALNDDGYYYYCVKNANGEVTQWFERLYVKINRDCEVINTEGTNTGFTYGKISLRYVNGYSYTTFIATYAAHVNTDGCYPVNEELKTFLHNYAKGNQIFFDGDGIAETDYAYSADEYSMWMFACGYYQA